MRFLVKVKPPIERINKSLQEGTFNSRMEQILSELKPEAAYFTEEDGHRTAFLVVHVDEPAQITRVGEPFFIGMGAEVHFHPAMTAQDLASANLHELARKWGSA